MTLLVSLAVPASAVTDSEMGSWTASESGLEIRIPDSYRDAKGYISFKDIGEGVNPGSGIVQAVAIYVPLPLDEYNALMEEQMEAYMSGDLEKLLAGLAPAEVDAPLA